MYKIKIDSSRRFEKEVTLTKNGVGVDSIFGDIDIVIAIRDLLKKNKLKVLDIKEFEPNLGPGSFTGLKIGVTVANVLNWVNGSRKTENLSVPDYGASLNIQIKRF